MLARQSGNIISRLSKGFPAYPSYNMSNLAGRKHDGKVAIVTASTEGIGFAIAKKLAQEGAKVMISSRKSQNVEKALEKLYQEGISKDSVKGVVCHVGNKDHRIKMIEQTNSEFGGIDYLISNAAVNPVMGNVLDCPSEAWDKIFEINVKTALLLTQEVHPFMLKRKGGNVVFISSIAGFQPFSILGAYSVSKTALLGLNKVLSQELGPDNIRVNCVCPGIIETKFSQPLHSNKDIAENALQNITLKRFGKPDEISGIVSFLCSDEASYITGESFVVSGGMPSRL